MSQQASPVLIGGFVLGALALLVAAILVFSSGVFFQDKQALVSYFPGTVSGLNVGSRVEFEGVQVGQVTEIDLELQAADGGFSVPVHYEIWSDHVSIIGEDAARNVQDIYRMLIEERGLRAKLDSVSLVTGQYMVSLSLQPGTEIRRVGTTGKDVIEIPTVESDRDRLANVLQGIELDQLISSTIQAMNAVRDLAASNDLHGLLATGDQTLEETRALIARLETSIAPLMQRLDATLSDYSSLARTGEARFDSLASSLEATSAEIQRVSLELRQEVDKVSRSATGAFTRADKAFASIDSLVGEGSGPRYDLELLLEEAASAARSLRILTDYLHQNPDAIIRGK